MKVIADDAILSSKLMKNEKHVKIRFGKARDLTWCMKHDEEAQHVDKRLIEHKISSKEIIVAELKGKIVGYLRLEYFWLKIPYIGLIFVLKEHQRQGIGRAILTFLEDYLRAKGYTFILSSSQVNQPVPSQVWHRSMGFKECGILSSVNERGIGEVFFRKPIRRGRESV